MTGQRHAELPPAKRRRLIFGAVLRGLVVTTELVVLYYLLPLARPWDAGTAVRLLIGLLVLAGITMWQVRAITGLRYPRTVTRSVTATDMASFRVTASWPGDASQFGSRAGHTTLR